MSPPPRFGCLDWNYWLRVLGVSAAAGVAVTLSFILFGDVQSVVTTFVHSSIYSICMGGLLGAILPQVAHRLAARRFTVKWVILLSTVLVLAVFGTALATAIITVLDRASGEAFWSRFTHDVRIVAIIAFILGISMTTYETLRARLEATTVELRTRELEDERMRKLALEARLASLESRLQPHFLFNTLNAISALIEEDPERAERIVERLAALLRFSLDATQRGTVPLAQELEIVVDYLEIEKARLGERLCYSVDVDPRVTGCEVLPLSAQTLVENSVKHAVAPRRAGGRIRVEAAAAGGDLTVTVWDDGPGFSPDTIAPGHGLDNLKSRLAVRFGATASLAVERRDGGTLVTICSPRTATALPVP